MGNILIRSPRFLGTKPHQKTPAHMTAAEQKNVHLMVKKYPHWILEMQ